MKINLKQASKNIHVGIVFSDPSFGSVVPPIYPSSTFRFSSAKQGANRFSGKEKGMIYSRFTNPTVETLEKRLAVLEHAQKAIATSSGMAAITTTLLHLLKKGDALIAHNVLYGGTYEFITHILPKFGVKVFLVDFNNTKQITAHIGKNTKALYFESPTNPLLEIIDIAKIVKIGKQYHIPTIVDNTFAPPPLQYPIDFGVDIVIHSLTKYIGGHSDLIGGAIIGSKKYIEPLFFHSYPFYGPTMSPFTAYLALRGITTLEVRLQKQEENAKKIAYFLDKHPLVSKVYYPALSSHPHHKLAKKQMNGYGSIISFEMKGGYAMAQKLVNKVKLITLAVSLGAVESLIEHPASMTHSELTPKEREKSHIKEGLIRLSVGLEDADDLIQDLTSALNKLG